jgi:nucleoside-diphosphate-sugar epimerase
MNFIVTGGARFIGSDVVEKLLEAGHNVVVVDNLSTGFIHNLPEHPFIKLLQKDILNCTPNDFADLFSGSSNGIAHLAAIPSVVTSWHTAISRVSSVWNFHPKRFLKDDKTVLKFFSDLDSQEKSFTNSKVNLRNL